MIGKARPIPGKAFLMIARIISTPLVEQVGRSLISSHVDFRVNFISYLLKILDLDCKC